MSPKRKDGKKCPGVSKQGNPCRSYFNDNDPNGFCGHCRRRANKAAKSTKKEARRQAKVVADSPNEQKLDYDPAEIMPCKARPGVCHVEVKVGEEGSKQCAMAVNPSKMADVTRRNRAKSTPLEKARFELARGLQSQLFSLQEGGGPFVVCDECQQGLIELFERDDIFLPFSFARRKYMERQDAEKERQDAAEAKAEALKQEATDKERLRREQKEKREEQQASKANAFMASLTVAPDEVEKGKNPDKGGDKPSLKSLTQRWMRDLIAGEHNDAHVKPVFLPKVETDEIHQCSNPHCSQQGSMADVARRQDGTVILIQRKEEEVPLPRMWISWQPLQLTHKQGNLQGQVIVDQESGKPVIKNKPVVLCFECGNVLRRTPRNDGIKAYTTPLSAAVEKAITQQRERDAKRWGSGDKSTNERGQSNRPSRRGRGKNGMKAHDFGHADPEDLRTHCGNGQSSSVATLSDAVKLPRYHC